MRIALGVFLASEVPMAHGMLRNPVPGRGANDVTSGALRLGFGPGTLEALNVSGEHLATVGPLQMKRGRLCYADAVGTLDDKKLVIGAVYEVVQHPSMQPDRYLAVVA